MTFREILLATDGYKTTMNAIEMGIELAMIFEARLHIISILDTTLIAKTGGIDQKIYNELKNGAEEAIEYVIKRIGKQKISTEKRIIEGKPSEEILSYTVNNKIDMIIAGTSQKKGFEKFLLGSVAEDLLRKSKIPVLVVPGNY